MNKRRFVQVSKNSYVDLTTYKFHSGTLPNILKGFHLPKERS